MNAAPPPGSPSPEPFHSAAGTGGGRSRGAGARPGRPSNVVIVLAALVVVLAGLLVVSVVRDDGDGATSTEATAAPSAPVNGAGAGTTAALPTLGPAATGGVGGDMATAVTAPPPTATLPPTTRPAATAAPTSPPTDATPTDATPAEVAVTTLDVAGLADWGSLGSSLTWVLASDGSASRSDDGGASWQQLDVPDGATSLTFADGTHGWVTTSTPGWFSTHDGGATWNDLGALGEVPSGDPVAADAAAGHVFLAVGGDGGLHLLLSPLDRDEPVDLGITVPYGAGPVFDVSMVARDGGAWVVSNDRTVVGGVLVEDGTIDAAWLPPAADAFGPVRVIAAAATPLVWAVADTGQWGGDSEPRARIYLSLDGGTAWQELQSPPGTGATIAAAAGAGPGTPTFYAGVGTVVYASSVQKLSDAPTWDEVDDLASGGVAAITALAGAAPGVIDAAVIVGDHQELWRSADGGATWQVLARATG